MAKRSGEKSGKEKFNKIGLVVKYHQDDAAELAGEVTRFLAEKGYRVFFAEESENIAQEMVKGLSLGSKVQVVAKDKLPSECDLVVVLGGDGTFLSIARLMRTSSVPVLGVNMGQLGFLTEIKKEEVFDVLSRILDRGDYQISERALLDVTVKRKDKKIFEGIVVNDAVISKGSIARIIGMDVSVDSQAVNHMRADGVIVSTPTGSTAYSLAAGGPVLEPTVPAVMITPICPHSLTLRPLVLADESLIEIKLSEGVEDVVLTLDGQEYVDMKEGDCVQMTRFRKHALQSVISPARDYFELLREKFNFGIRSKGGA